MKKLVIAVAVILSINISTVWAESNSTNTTTSSVRYVKAPRFARPLVEKWISEYAKTQPGIEFQIAKGNQQSNIDLNVVFDSQENHNQDFSHTVYFGETAVLPITARRSEAARLLEGKHLNSKKLKQLFFLDDDFEEDVKKNKQFERLIVYSGSNASSVAIPFAQSFGEESTNYRGKRIAGDDLFLNTALQKDPLGVSFNTLPNIFDLQSRRVKDDLTLIGINVKKDLEQTFSDDTTLDDVINTLENSKVQEIAIEKVGISYNGVDDAVIRFIGWVLDDGTKFNHQYGLLNLDSKIADTQKEKVKTIFTAQK